MTSVRIRSFGLIALAVAALAGPLAGIAQAASPTNTHAPAISGTAQVGQTLTYTTGTWDDATATVVDQWWSCNPGCAEISGTTDNQPSYAVQSTDLNATIEIHETATDTTADPPSAIDSTPVGPVTAAPPPPSPTNTTPPSITGTTTSGSILAESGDNWTGNPTSFTWQWLRCATTCNPIPNATASTYPLTDADVGDTIEVQMTASNSNPTPSASVTSAPTATIVGARPTNTAPPSITGTTITGSVLTESGDTWTGSPTSFTWQWLRCTATCNPITNATASTYPLTDADVGATIKVQMTAGNTNPSRSAVVTSAPTAAIAGATPTNTTPPTITGTTILGSVLTETGDTWTSNPTTFTYQWLRCATATTCTPITANATGKTYTLVAADVGATMEVQITASNSNPTPSAIVTSAPTAAVVPPAPNIVAAPTIGGTAQDGKTLTEGAAKWGTTWPPTSTAIQWYQCDSNNFTCVPVSAPAGIAKNYTLTDTDIGATMQVAETATNAGGSTTNYSGFSAPVTNVDQIVPAPAVVAGSSPAIAGSAQLGRTLTGTGAQFSGNPGTFNYQWLRCNAVGCSPIPGETDVRYTPASADVGDSIVLAETAINSGGTSNTVQSSRTDAITAPSTTAVQTNSSAPFAGQAVTLIATVTSAAGSVKPAGTVDFHANGGAIPGCTGLTLGTAAPTAVCQTSFPASVANVTAAYSAAPGTFITGSTSSPTAIIVGRATTTVTLAAPAHVSLGNKTTYTATVHPPAGSALNPTGRVTFTDAGKSIKGCGGETLAARGTPCSIKYLGLKQHRIAAQYGGDANFAPSASTTSHVLVQPQTPSGFVSVFIYWSFKFSQHTTRIGSLSVSGLSAGIHIAVTCRGGGCPFAHRTMTVSAPGKCGKGKAARSGCVAAPSFSLTSMFRGAHLRVGARLIVAVTHPGWVGKYYRFTIRAGRRPSTGVSCLAVNGTRPGVGCRAS